MVNNDKNERVGLEKASFPLKIIENRENVGFARACNQAAKEAKGEYLFFLNPDAKIAGKDFYKIIREFEQNPQIGAAGPGIIEEITGKPQPWIGGGKTSLPKVLFKNTLNKHWNKKTKTKVDWVSGTALLTSKKIFNKLGGFDENFFMYFEDQDYCLRAKKLGLKILFLPEFKVLHCGGKSWKSQKSQKKRYYISQQVFFDKHMPLQAKILKILHKFILKL